MDNAPETDITRLLHYWNDGDEGAKEQLLPYVYNEMRRQARMMMSRERADHTLQPTALVHEAFLRLSEQTGLEWRDRRHFYGFASRTMRQILVDHARKLSTNKRGNRPVRFSIDDIDIPVEDRAYSIIILHDALEELSRYDEQQARIVEMRFFGGLTVEEIADALGVSERTVSRDWQAARLWLYHELKKGS